MPHKFSTVFSPALLQSTPPVTITDSTGHSFDPRGHFSIYVDDGKAAPKTFPQHLALLRAIFQVCRPQGWELNASKCAFNCNVIGYAGFVISSNGHTMPQARRQGLATIPVPTTQKQVRALLGAANFFRPYVSDFANISKPLTQLTGKKTIFHWGGNQQKAYEAPTHACKTCPLLAYPNYDKPKYPETINITCEWSPFSKSMSEC